MIINNKESRSFSWERNLPHGTLQMQSDLEIFLAVISKEDSSPERVDPYLLTLTWWRLNLLYKVCL